MYSDFDRLFDDLLHSKFRNKFRLTGDDRYFAKSRPFETLVRHASEIIEKRLAPASPARDGSQTPMRGHPVFVAQHATGCCCRNCLLKWHEIPKGRELTSAEKEYVVKVIGEWIKRDLEKEPVKRKIRKGETGFLFDLDGE